MDIQQNYWTPQNVHARIKELCDEVGWTINRLCSEAGITASTLYSIPSRNTFPSLNTLNLICSALGISLSYFFNIDNNLEQEFVAKYNQLDKTCQRLLIELANHLH